MQLNEIMRRKKGPREERVTRTMTDYIVEKFLFDANESFGQENVPGNHHSYKFGGTTKEDWIRYRLLERQMMSYIGEPLDEAVIAAYDKLSQMYEPLSDVERAAMTRREGD